MLATDRDGLVLDAPPIAHRIAREPRLSHLAIIASTADTSLLPRGGTRGFPHWGVWGERRSDFGTSILDFLATGTTPVAKQKQKQQG